MLAGAAGRPRSADRRHGETMTDTTKIAILGAGNVGASLGVNLCRHGFPVRFGVRAGSDDAELLARCEGKAQATSVADAAAWADVVFLALPAGAVVEVARAAGDLTGKILVDCSNPVGWTPEGPTLQPPADGSVAAALAKAIPGARVVKGFNGFGAEFHLDPRVGGAAADVYLAGDDAAAKGVVASIADRAGFSAIDAGPLRNAALLESLAVLWIHLALKGGKGGEGAFKRLTR